MCGIHNYAKDLTVQNLHSFIMKGAAESREKVIIVNQLCAKLGRPNCTIIQFLNVTFVEITTVTMWCSSIKLKEGHITVNDSTLYGYAGKKKLHLCFINIVGKGSQALLDKCRFSHCFIVSNFSDGIVVSSSIFQSYKHQQHSIITVLS